MSFAFQVEIHFQLQMQIWQRKRIKNGIDRNLPDTGSNFVGWHFSAFIVGKQEERISQVWNEQVVLISVVSLFIYRQMQSQLKTWNHYGMCTVPRDHQCGCLVGCWDLSNANNTDFFRFWTARMCVRPESGRDGWKRVSCPMPTRVQKDKRFVLTFACGRVYGGVFCLKNEWEIFL